MAGRYLTLKDMTGGSGCTPRTVRYYERQGLLRASRTAGGHRMFAQAELQRLLFIVGLREAGWTLEEVEALLHVRGDGEADREGVARLDVLLAAHIARLERKIELLARMRDDLASTHALLAVCAQCTSTAVRVECEACERVPALSRLPQGFRLAWRARELDGAPAFDEPAADVDPIAGGER